MKTQFLTLIMSLFFSSLAIAQTEEENRIRATINTFASAADEQNVDVLNTVLNDNFRITMNQLFGSKESSIVDKGTYLSKIKSKEWGGDQRTVSIKSIELIGNNASARVVLKGKKSTIETLLQLIKNNDGSWQIINDLPTFL